MKVENTPFPMQPSCKTPCGPTGMSTIVCMNITGKIKNIIRKEKANSLFNPINDLTLKIYGGQSMALIVTLMPAAN